MTEIIYTYYSTTPLSDLMAQTNGKAYRKQVDPCNFCDFDASKDEKNRKWRSTATRVVFIPPITIGMEHPVYWKKGTCIVVSKCPECEKESFRHYALGDFVSSYDDRFDFDKEKFKAEITKWKLHSLKVWERSQCKTCEHIQDINLSPYGFTLVCKAIGFSHKPEEKADYDQYSSVCNNYSERG